MFTQAGIDIRGESGGRVASPNVRHGPHPSNLLHVYERRAMSPRGEVALKHMEEVGDASIALTHQASALTDRNGICQDIR